MSRWDEAQRILRDTERSLRALIEAALAEHCYSEVAAIATTVEAVASLQQPPILMSGEVEPENGGQVDPMPAVGQPNSPQRVSRSGRSRRGLASTEFPRFERDGDKLVKLGWSKRDERIYEHRAPRDIVFTVSSAIAGKVKPKSVFTMDQILPINDEAGHEIPSYQAYLALAWLRSLGIVNRKGKEGYRLAIGTLDGPTLKRLWTAVPERR
jgi:hypothetical protein